MMQRSLGWVPILVLAAGVPTQGPAVAADFVPYGAGCPTTHWHRGPAITLPASAYRRFGQNGSAPFTQRGGFLQQILPGRDLGPERTLLGIGLRQPENAEHVDGEWTEFEVWIGGTQQTAQSMIASLDENYDLPSMPRTLAFARRRVWVPAIGPKPLLPTTHFVIPLDRPTTTSLGTTGNLLIEFRCFDHGGPLEFFSYPAESLTDASTAYVHLNQFGEPQVARGRGLVYELVTAGSVDSARPELNRVNYPVLGTNFHLVLGWSARNAAGALMLGRSRTQWHGLTLPWDMVVLGAPGCLLLASPDVVLPYRATIGGDAAFSLAVPPVPSLSGQSVHVQALVEDRAANGLGLTTSNAGQLVLGFPR